jgi:putative component of toxin-antitoxin plasmid stabilization module
VLYLDKAYAVLNVKYMNAYDYTVAGGAILGVKYYAGEGWRIYYQENYSL